MEAKPLRIVPSSHNTISGSGPQNKIDRGERMEGDVEESNGVVVLVKEEGSSLCAELGLGVGAHYSDAAEAEAEEAVNPNPVIAARHKCYRFFTEAQRREFEHQVFIFNHFAYNLPFPHHLVRPVLNKSVAAGTLDSGFGAFCKQFPSYMSDTEDSRHGFDFGRSMGDPDPHRCRRTDGKKWRCSKKVVPDQKYCERHMHRGRNRSRKHVESSELSSSLITKPSGKSHSKLGSNPESAVSNPNPLGTQPMNTSSCTPSRSCIVNSLPTNNRLKDIIGSDDCQPTFSPATTVAADSTPSTAVAPKVTTFSSTSSFTSNNRSTLNTCKKYNQTKNCIGNSISIGSGGKGSIIYDSTSITTGIGFSPRSVLQVSGCNHSYPNGTNSVETEPGRCRRTDGKKWRCKSAVLPGQKYCATHMHRGAKKRFADHEPATTPGSAVTIARLPYSTATPSTQKAYCTTLNTSLSMSIPASSPLIQCKEKSPSSSDTDTTISDTMNEYSHASF